MHRLERDGTGDHTRVERWLANLAATCGDSKNALESTKDTPVDVRPASPARHVE